MVFVRLHIDNFGFLLLLLVLFAAFIILLTRSAVNLTPQQFDWLSERLHGLDNTFNQTITLPGKFKISTQGSIGQFSLRSQSAKKVKYDLDAFDISLSNQPFRTPDNLDFPTENKPRHIVINVVSEPQLYFVLYDESAKAELGSLSVARQSDKIELNIHLPAQSSPEITSWQITKLVLYGLYALTHDWPSDEASMISQINTQFVEYYGQQEHPPTFYVK